MSQLVFLTFFLGLVSGRQTVSLNASPDIRTVAILLDEQKVAALQPPFTGTIDLGGRLAPRQLVAVGYDDRGNEVARATQVLNVPHPPAEAAIVLSDGNRRAEIRWMEKANEAPAEVHLSVDGEAVPLDKTYTGSLPSLTAASPHVIEAELRFPAGAVARHDVTIAGGAYAGSVDSELTPVVVQGDARPEQLSRCFDARVSAVEKSRAFVVTVKDPDAGSAVRSFAREFPIAQWQEIKNIDPLDGDTSGSILWPVMQMRTRAGNPTMAIYGSSPDFDAKEFGVLWALTRGNRSLPLRAERRYTDAVAVAGMLRPNEEHGARSFSCSNRDAPTQVRATPRPFAITCGRSACLCTSGRSLRQKTSGRRGEKSRTSPRHHGWRMRPNAFARTWRVKPWSGSRPIRGTRCAPRQNRVTEKAEPPRSRTAASRTRAIRRLASILSPRSCPAPGRASAE